MRNTSRFHPFSCCCPTCLDNETRECCTRCEDGVAVDGEDYCRRCLDVMFGGKDEDEADAAESDVYGA
jgi:hypothetical protein